MKKLIVALAVVSSLWIGDTAAQAGPAPAAATTFTSKQGYSITPPKGWTTERSGMMGADVIFLSKPKNGAYANINVLVITAEPRGTLQARGTQINQLYPRLFNQFKWIARGKTTVDGVPALFYTVNHSIGTSSRRLWVHQIVTLKNGLFYEFTCTALDRDRDVYKAAFDNALRSIRWTRRSSVPASTPAPGGVSP